MEFVPFEEGIEVHGQAVMSVLHGLSGFSVLASGYLLDEGIGRPNPSGVAEVDARGWYPQRAWLRCFQRIRQQLGDGVLTQIGMALPRSAAFLEGCRELHGAIRSLDVAYHRNHRRQGQPMFDPATGRLLEGIGHYGYEPVPGQRRILSVCHTPYPCAFDQGVLTALAQRFEPGARVAHADGKPCRTLRGNHCTYVLSW